MIAAVAAFSLIPWLGRLHLFDWDEINFAEGAREMLVTLIALVAAVGSGPAITRSVLP